MEGRDGTAIHPDNEQGRFYRAMLEAFCSAGAGRIYRYRFGDRVVAIDLCIEGGGALVILKTTYDESIKTISPAFLMREESFRGLFGERRLKRIEFFGKLMEWHTRWTDDIRTFCGDQILIGSLWCRHSKAWLPASRFQRSFKNQHSPNITCSSWADRVYADRGEELHVAGHQIGRWTIFHPAARGRIGGNGYRGQ